MQNKEEINKITEKIKNFVYDIKTKAKGLEISIPLGEFPSYDFSANEFVYFIGYDYTDEHSNIEKHGSTGTFPIYYSPEKSIFIIFNPDNNFQEMELNKLELTLKKAEEYILSCSSK